MTNALALIAIKTCIEESDLSGVAENITLLLQVTSEAEASEKLAGILIDVYTAYKSDYLAKVLEVIIRKNPNLALIHLPDNPLFVAAVGTGSVEMYESYIKEAVLPFLTHVDKEEHFYHYLELQDKAQHIADQLFADLKKSVKGIHYNNAFSTPDIKEGTLLIHRKDYDVMERILESNNAIIGRRDIIKDLERRREECLESGNRKEFHA